MFLWEHHCGANDTAFCFEGLLVARLKGNIARVGNDYAKLTSTKQPGIVVDTVIGNKLHPADKTGLFDEVTLTTSAQVIPLVWFCASLTADNASNRGFIANNSCSAAVNDKAETQAEDLSLVYGTQETLQAIVDKFYNSGKNTPIVKMSIKEFQTGLVQMQGATPGAITATTVAVPLTTAAATTASFSLHPLPAASAKIAILAPPAAGPTPSTAASAARYVFVLLLWMMIGLPKLRYSLSFAVVEVIVHLSKLVTRIVFSQSVPRSASSQQQPTAGSTADGASTNAAASSGAATLLVVPRVPPPSTMIGIIQYLAPSSLRNTSATHLQHMTAQEVGNSGKEDCPICLCALVDEDEVKVHKTCATTGLPIHNREKRLVKLPCGHMFHEDCIGEALVKVGNICPYQCLCVPPGKSPSGTMSVTRKETLFCAGYDQNSSSGTVVIEYHIPRAKQLSYHDNPGTLHSGATRICYLPDDADGGALLKRLQYAFKHGYTFTVGTSMTTGTTDQVTWASIPHKTKVDGGAATYGFPDPTYIAICNAELDALGVPGAADL